MKNVTLALVLFALSVGSLASRSQALAGDGSIGGDCPDTMASQVDARIEWRGEANSCSQPITIFGWNLGTLTIDCPTKVFIYPAHQECRGEPSEGTFCMVTGMLEVTTARCECRELELLGLTIPFCKCAKSGSAGHVEDARTFPCQGVGVG